MQVTSLNDVMQQTCEWRHHRHAVPTLL